MRESQWFLGAWFLPVVLLKGMSVKLEGKVEKGFGNDIPCVVCGQRAYWSFRDSA